MATPSKLVDLAKKSDPDISTMTIAEKKARFAAVLERGHVNYALQVDLPPHLTGQWVRNTPNDIAQAEAMGYTMDTEYAPKRRLHGTADGTSRMGDVVHMLIAKEDRELIGEVLQDRINKVHGLKGHKPIEDTTLDANLQKTGVIPIGESTIQEADANHIMAATQEK